MRLWDYIFGGTVHEDSRSCFNGFYKWGTKEAEDLHKAQMRVSDLLARHVGVNATEALEIADSHCLREMARMRFKETSAMMELKNKERQDEIEARQKRKQKLKNPQSIYLRRRGKNK